MRWNPLPLRGVRAHLAASVPLFWAVCTTSLTAQETVAGQVLDALTDQGLAGASVRIFRSNSLLGSDVTGRTGRFRIEEISDGDVTVEVRRLGYQVLRRELALDGREVILRMRRAAIPLDPVVVSDSRDRGTLLDAEASISLVTRDQIQDQMALTPAEHIRSLPGVDFSKKGIVQGTYGVRGDRSANSQSLRTVTDYRFAAIPSIGFNVPYLIPTTNDDIERIELMRGPGSALYGPEADRGVLHIVTRSPFESQGTSLSFGVGERSLVHGAARHARLISDAVAIKLSVDYLSGDDWDFRDPAEIDARAAALAAGAEADTLLVGARNIDLERWAGEMRLDWRPDLGSEVSLTAGLAQAVNLVDVTSEVGGVQVQDWTYRFLQGRLEMDRLSANVFANFSDAGETYQLRTGARLVDESRLWAVQVKHGATVGGRTRLQYGIDVRRTIPRTGGTINGSNEDRDELSELGAYLHSNTRLSPAVSLVAALRGDYHSFLDDLVASPRVSVMLNPRSGHMIRLSYNRAFRPPDASDIFQDIVAGRLGPLPYRIRAVGRPEGYTFRRDCNGLCMRSPFNPQGPDAYLATDATLLWGQLIGILQAQDPTIPNLPAPPPGEVETVLAILDPETSTFEPFVEDVRDARSNERETTSAFELGYTGLLGGHTRVTFDVYRTELSDIESPTAVQTPNVFLDRSTLVDYLEALGLPAADAQALATGLAQIPAGVVSPVESPNPTDILLFNRQGGEVSFWGFDLSLESILADRWQLKGSVSWVSKDSLAIGGLVADYVLNGPRSKGALEVAYDDDERGIYTQLAVRAVAAFPVVSGVYVGRVEGYEVVDASLRYQLPWFRALTVGISATNLLDNLHREFLGVPEIGRLIVTEVRASF